MDVRQWISDGFEWLDAAVTRVAARLGRLRPLHLDVYRSYGTAHRLYVKGRLLADRGLTPQTEADSPWRNFQAMYRRFNSREIPGADVLACLPGAPDYYQRTDPEGYFTFNLDPPALPPTHDYLWHQVPVQLARLPYRFRGLHGTVRATAEVMIPPPTAEFGIISDLDDTVIVTRATHIWRMLRTVLLRNAYSHEPLAGVAAFYQALLRGGTDQPDNPFFYVSSSPWNLYDVLVEFLHLRGIPPGPLLLRDTLIGRPVLAEGEEAPASGHHYHKLKEISQVFDTYPQLSFVLLGDNGQQDPLIYDLIVRRYPGRVRVVYIRDVGVPQRATPVAPVAEALRRDTGVDMLLVPDYLAAATHAAHAGLILPEGLEKVRASTARNDES